jgi:hypothetical protein
MTDHYKFVTGWSPTDARWQMHDLVRLYADQPSRNTRRPTGPSRLGIGAQPLHRHDGRRNAPHAPLRTWRASQLSIRWVRAGRLGGTGPPCLLDTINSTGSIPVRNQMFLLKLSASYLSPVRAVTRWCRSHPARHVAARRQTAPAIAVAIDGRLRLEQGGELAGALPLDRPHRVNTGQRCRGAPARRAQRHGRLCWPRRSPERRTRLCVGAEARPSVRV